MKTDENGRFRFANLKAGRYTLAAIAPGFITPVENTFGSRSRAIDLSDGENVENQEIALKRGGVITGRVTGANGKPLVEQLVNLTRFDERGQPIRTRDFSQYSGLTDDRGLYRIYGLPAGRYLVSAGFAQREGWIMMTVDRSLLSTHIPSRYDRRVEGQSGRGQRRLRGHRYQHQNGRSEKEIRRFRARSGRRHGAASARRQDVDRLSNGRRQTLRLL